MHTYRSLPRLEGEPMIDSLLLVEVPPLVDSGVREVDCRTNRSCTPACESTQSWSKHECIFENSPFLTARKFPSLLTMSTFLPEHLTCRVAGVHTIEYLSLSTLSSAVVSLTYARNFLSLSVWRERGSVYPIPNQPSYQIALYFWKCSFFNATSHSNVIEPVLPPDCTHPANLHGRTDPQEEREQQRDKVHVYLRYRADHKHQCGNGDNGQWKKTLQRGTGQTLRFGATCSNCIFWNARCSLSVRSLSVTPYAISWRRIWKLAFCSFLSSSARSRPMNRAGKWRE